MSYVMKFGKHSGKKIHDVPRRYLNWLLEEFEDSDSFFMLSDKDKEELTEEIEIEFAIRDRSHITF